MATILIIENSSINRAKQISNSLNEGHQIYLSYHGSKKNWGWGDKKFKNTDSFPNKFDILFRHRPDPHSEDIQFDLHIVYSGGGITANQLNENEFGFNGNFNDINDDWISQYVRFSEGKGDCPQGLIPSGYFKRIKGQYDKLANMNGPSERFGEYFEKFQKGLLVLNEFKKEELINHLGLQNDMDDINDVEGESFRAKLAKVHTIPEMYDIVFVAEELTHGGVMKFNGVEVVKELRRAGVTAPIILLGFNESTVKLTEKRKEPEYAILNSSLVYRYILDEGEFDEPDKQKWEDCRDLGIDRLDLNTLEEIQYYRIDWRGLLHHALHDIRAEFIDNNWLAEDINSLCGYVNDYLDKKVRPLIKPGNIEQFKKVNSDCLDSIEDYFSENKINLEKPDEAASELREVIRGFDKRWESLLKGENRTEEQRKEIKSWAVLVVDDQEAESIKEMLEEAGLTAIAANSGKKAVEILKKDAKGELEIGGNRKPAKFISVLIADWIMEDEIQGVKVMQPLQGPGLISYLKRNIRHNLAFFVLSSRSGGIMRQAQKNLGESIGWFAKERVISRNPLDKEEFFEKLEEAGKYKYDELIHRPEDYASSWKRLAGIYSWYRGLPVGDKKNIDDEINSLTDNWVKGVQEACEKNEEGNVISLDDGKLPDLMNLRSIIQSKTGEYNDTHCKNFIHKMAARRIILSLSVDGWHWSGIFRLIDERILIPAAKNKNLVGNDKETQAEVSSLLEGADLSFDENHNLARHLLQGKDWKNIFFCDNKESLLGELYFNKKKKSSDKNPPESTKVATNLINFFKKIWVPIEKEIEQKEVEIKELKEKKDKAKQLKVEIKELRDKIKERADNFFIKKWGDIEKEIEKRQCQIDKFQEEVKEKKEETKQVREKIEELEEEIRKIENDFYKNLRYHIVEKENELKQKIDNFWEKVEQDESKDKLKKPGKEIDELKKEIKKLKNKTKRFEDSFFKKMWSSFEEKINKYQSKLVEHQKKIDKFQEEVKEKKEEIEKLEKKIKKLKGGVNNDTLIVTVEEKIREYQEKIDKFQKEVKEKKKETKQVKKKIEELEGEIKLYGYGETVLDIRLSLRKPFSQQKASDLFNTHLALSKEKTLNPLLKHGDIAAIDPGSLTVEEVIWLENGFEGRMGRTDAELLEELQIYFLDQQNYKKAQETVNNIMKFIGRVKIKFVNNEAIKGNCKALEKWVKDIRANFHFNDEIIFDNLGAYREIFNSVYPNIEPLTAETQDGIILDELLNALNDLAEEENNTLITGYNTEIDHLKAGLHDFIWLYLGELNHWLNNKVDDRVRVALRRNEFDI